MTQATSLPSARMSSESPAGGRWQSAIPTLDGLWALVAVAVPTAGTFLGRMLAFDLAYQIRAGEVMLDSHRLLDTDIFTFTVNGQPWLNQQWGAQVIFAAIHRMGGWDGIAIFRGVLVGMILAILYRTCRGAGAAPRTAALLTIAGWVVSIDMLPWMRPQLLGFLLFTAALWVVVTRHASPNRIWWIPALMVPWANLHGSFPLVIVLMGIAWLEDNRQDPASGRKIALVGVVTALTSLVNPFGVRIWPYALNVSTDPIVAREAPEWAPPAIGTSAGILLVLSLVAVAIVLVLRSRSAGWTRVLTLGLFGGLALVVTRGVGWWALVAPVMLASILRDHERSRETARPWMHLAIAFIIAAATLLALPIRRGVDPDTGGPAVLQFAPERLVSEARRVTPPGSHVFATQSYASWVEFSAPSLPVAVDSRVELFSRHVWDDYHVVSAGLDGWDEVLERWEVEILILRPGDAAGLLRVLMDRGGWRVVVRDASGVVYARS